MPVVLLCSATYSAGGVVVAGGVDVLAHWLRWRCCAWPVVFWSAATPVAVLLAAGGVALERVASGGGVVDAGGVAVERLVSAGGV